MAVTMIATIEQLEAIPYRTLIDKSPFAALGRKSRSLPTC
jgi:hypothetical protein